MKTIDSETLNKMVDGLENAEKAEQTRKCSTCKHEPPSECYESIGFCNFIDKWEPKEKVVREEKPKHPKLVAVPYAECAECYFYECDAEKEGYVTCSDYAKEITGVNCGYDVMFIKEEKSKHPKLKSVPFTKCSDCHFKDHDKSPQNNMDCPENAESITGINCEETECMFVKEEEEDCNCVGCCDERVCKNKDCKVEKDTEEKALKRMIKEEVFELEMEQVEKGKTKAPKESDGKARFDLIPPYPLFELAKIYNMGNNAKYPRRSWEVGIPFGDCYRSLMSHIVKWQDGETLDPETGLHNLAHAAYWTFALMMFEVTNPELDDRSKHQNLISREGYKQTWKINEDFKGKVFK